MALIDDLKKIVGPGNWATEGEALQLHLQEWRDIWRGSTAIMLQPGSVSEVSAIVKACAEAGVGIVPQGGNTGLCGGAIPDASGNQVLLSLARMNNIRNVSAADHTLVVEAGCTLTQVQEAAAGAGCFFPLSLAAEGSCQIGGNLSTNAGGINVLRYGTARDQALGLEVVLPDGRIWEGLRTLRKDTSGYDLKQWFIGAEGTLGIITAASLKMYPAVRDQQTAVVTLESPQQAVRLLALLRQALADQVQAFELIPRIAVEFVQKHIPDSRFPEADSLQWQVLIEIANQSDESALQNVLIAALEAGLLADVVIAKSRGEAEAMWRTRHAISEAQKKEGGSLKHDVSVPVAVVADFVEAASAEVLDAMPGIRPVAFGHVGDGNIHFNLSQPSDWTRERFLAEREPLARIVYDVVQSFDGSISAEHGIGQAKVDHLRHYRGELEVELMRAMKNALDPHNIMNPGKVI